MNTGIKIALAAVAGFIGGGVCGWFARKQTEIKFEVCTDEEQLAYAEAVARKNGKTIAERIDEEFTPEKEAEKQQEEPPAVKAINTQKTQYMKMYREEGGQYDRHGTLEEGEEPVTSEQDENGFDRKFMSEVEGSDEEDREETEQVPDIEDSDLQEFYHWNSIPDGEYDTISVGWFSADEVLVDDDNLEIRNPIRYLGFDPKEAFANKKAIDGDPDAVYKKNNKYKTIFEVIRYNTSYNVKKRMEEFGGD